MTDIGRSDLIQLLIFISGRPLSYFKDLTDEQLEEEYKRFTVRRR